MRVYKRGYPCDKAIALFVRFWRFQNWCFQNSFTNVSRHGAEISRATAWGSVGAEILKRAEYETIANVTPSRVITVAMPSYTRYLNPHGSLVSRRRDLVKATQPIPTSKLRCSQSWPFYRRRSSSSISLGNAFPVHPIELYHYASIASVSTDRLPDGPLALRALCVSFDRERHFMTSINVNRAWLNILPLLGQHLSFDEYDSLSDRIDLANRAASR